jgi:hypothetical protein
MTVCIRLAYMDYAESSQLPFVYLGLAGSGL